MNLKIIRTDQVYQQVLTLSPEQGEALFRKEVLAPFRGKFARQGLSIEAGQGGGCPADFEFGQSNAL